MEAGGGGNLQPNPNAAPDSLDGQLVAARKRASDLYAEIIYLQLDLMIANKGLSPIRNKIYVLNKEIAILKAREGRRKKVDDLVDDLSYVLWKQRETRENLNKSKKIVEELEIQVGDFREETLRDQVNVLEAMIVKMKKDLFWIKMQRIWKQWPAVSLLAMGIAASVFLRRAR